MNLMTIEPSGTQPHRVGAAGRSSHQRFQPGARRGRLQVERVGLRRTTSTAPATRSCARTCAERCRPAHRQAVRELSGEGNLRAVAAGLAAPQRRLLGREARARVSARARSGRCVVDGRERECRLPTAGSWDLHALLAPAGLVQQLDATLALDRNSETPSSRIFDQPSRGFRSERHLDEESWARSHRLLAGADIQNINHRASPGPPLTGTAASSTAQDVEGSELLAGAFAQDIFEPGSRFQHPGRRAPSTRSRNHDGKVVNTDLNHRQCGGQRHRRYSDHDEKHGQSQRRRRSTARATTFPCALRSTPGSGLRRPASSTRGSAPEAPRPKSNSELEAGAAARRRDRRRLPPRRPASSGASPASGTSSRTSSSRPRSASPGPPAPPSRPAARSRRAASAGSATTSGSVRGGRGSSSRASTGRARAGASR